ncbi:hypothetical protein Hanom_Chr09g00841831 [Helianthus anomalus]
MGKRFKSYASFCACERRKQHSRKMAKLEVVTDTPMGRRRHLVHFQFSPTPYFPVYGGFWLREKLIADAL